MVGWPTVRSVSTLRLRLLIVVGVATMRSIWRWQGSRRGRLLWSDTGYIRAECLWKATAWLSSILVKHNLSWMHWPVVHSAEALNKCKAESGKAFDLAALCCIHCKSNAHALMGLGGCCCVPSIHTGTICMLSQGCEYKRLYIPPGGQVGGGACVSLQVWC